MRDLVDGHADDVAVHNGHAVQGPVLRGLRDGAIDLVEARGHAHHQLARVFCQRRRDQLVVVGAIRAYGHSEAGGLACKLSKRAPRQLVLVEHLHSLAARGGMFVKLGHRLSFVLVFRAGFVRVFRACRSRGSFRVASRAAARRAGQRTDPNGRAAQVRPFTRPRKRAGCRCARPRRRSRHLSGRPAHRPRRGAPQRPRPPDAARKRPAP